MKRIPVSAAILLALALTQAVPSSAAPDDGSAMKEAVTAYNIGQYKRTFDIVKPLADKGNTRAAVLLGRLYENGLGVDPDPVTAAEWYRKAAEGGSVEGMKLLSFASSSHSFSACFCLMEAKLTSRWVLAKVTISPIRFVSFRK